MNDLVSVIMPSYNTEKYIRASIESVQEQTYQDWELLIVDDCSTDETVAIVRELMKGDARIKLFTLKQNHGAAICRNKALRETKGRWIAFLDSDDIWHPQKLERQLAFMKEHGYTFTYTDYRIQLNGKWLPYRCTGPNKVTHKTILNYCFFSTITVCYNRETIGLIQIPNLKKNNDYAMWLRALTKADAYRFPECLSFYIKHDDSVSGGSKLKLVKWYYLLWRTEGKKTAIAVIFTLNNLIWGVLKRYMCRAYETETDIRKSLTDNDLNATIRLEDILMDTRISIGERIQLSDLAKLYPDEYVFATKVDNDHPDYPDDFWIYYAGHARFQDREKTRKELLNAGYKTHWYRTTPNKEFTSVGLIGSF